MLLRMKNIFLGFCQEFRWSFLPPLMVYFSVGVSGLTGIVGTFFVKDYLNLSAAFLAGLGFWAMLPWALKMPLGHLVDLLWRYKNYLLYLGALILILSVSIMYGLIAHTAMMSEYLSIESWYVISVLIGPVGYVLQDVVADAMTVEAVPSHDEHGQLIDESLNKQLHTTMQALGRFAIIFGTVCVALVNLILFSGTENLNEADKIDLYASIYLWALISPFLSVCGVWLATYHAHYLKKKFGEVHLTQFFSSSTEINWTILGGSLVFVIFSLTVGLLTWPFSQEIVFAGSFMIVLFLMYRLTSVLSQQQRMMVIGTAIVIFMFRATPGTGPGFTWFAIDELAFNEQFLSLLSLIISVLTLLGIWLFRSFMIHNSIVRIIIVLSCINVLFSLPTLGLYYGLHQWTASVTGGVIDAKFIMVVNTALDSPFGQVAMIPILAWIAKNAPIHMKATFFAVFSSFTNLALSASDLGTKYLNQIFVVTREVSDKLTGEVVSVADYSQLGKLIVTVVALSFLIPVISVLLVQSSRFRTAE